MQYLDRIELRNFATYQQASFSFEPGLHVVRGPNGSGKSLLFSAIANLLYGTPPLATRAKQAKHYLPPSSEIELAWHNSSHWLAVQRRHGAGLRYSLQENGTALAPHRIADAQSAIGSALPITAAQFYTFVYINALRPSILLGGSETDRRNFFEELFALQEYETIRAALMARAEAARAAAETYQYLQTELAQLQQRVWPRQLVQRVQQTRRRLQSLQLWVRRLRQVVNHSRQARTLSQQLRFRLGQRRTRQQLRRYRRQLVQTIAVEKAWAKENAARAANANTRRVQTRLQKQLRQLPATTSFRHHQLQQLEVKFQRLEQQAAKVAELADISRAAKKLGRPQQNKRQVQQQLQTARSLAHAAKQVLAKLQRITRQPHCPLCQQALSANYTRRLQRQQQAQLQTQQKAIGKLKRELQRHQLAHTLRDYPHNYRASTHQQVRRQLRQLQQRARTHQQRQELQAALQRLPKLLPTNGKLSAPRVDSQQLTATITRLQTDAKIYRQLRGTLGLAARQQLLSQRLVAAEKRLQQLIARHQHWHSLLQAWNHDQQQIARLQKQLQSRAKLAADGEILKGLVAAYGPRGLKLQHMQHLLQSYETQLNATAGHVFQRSFKFKVETTTTGFKILAHRNGVVTDVNLLSGAESRIFSVLSWLALLPYVPANHRCNVAIFDEVEANMSNQAKDRFVRNLLPVVAEQVPCLVLVTPQSPQDFYVPNATTHTISYRNEHSILTRG